MKLKYYLNGLLAALLLATASCSTDELVKKDGEQPEINADGTRTLKLRFDGLSIGADNPGTKAGSAIATDEENLVDDLLMLLISFTTGEQEIWHYSKDNLDEPDGVDKLLFEQDGKVLNGVIKTKLTGELSAVILTNGLTLSPTEAPVKLEDWPLVTEVYKYKKYILTTKNADGIYRTRRTDLATQPITTPLPMYNYGATIPENSTSTVIPLERLVARFDLQNKIDNLRILRITPRNAIDIAFNSPIDIVEDQNTRIDKMAPVSVYTDADYDSDAAIASQKAAPLFYTIGTQYSVERKHQQPMTFDVDAVYKDATGNWINKTYSLNLTRDGRQVEIYMNTRYTIVLTDATDQTLTGSILISDWNTGDQIDGGMGNTGAVPEFAFPAQAANMPTIQVGTSNQHILVVDPKATGSSIKLSIPNYKTAIETGAANTDNVLDKLSFDIIPLDGNEDNIWIKSDETTPFELSGDALICTFAAKTTSAPDSYAGQYPSLMIRVKNKVNPAQYMAVKVISWMMTESGGSQDRYGNTGTEADPYEIHTTDDMLAMMGTPSYAFKDKYISLENDIDLSEYVFEKGVQAPLVGSLVSDKGLNTCTFNGNNHTIRNFTLKRDISVSGIDGSNPVHAIGFFSCKTATSTISDLSITGSITVNATSGNYNYQVGGITSNPSGGDSYINCHSHIDITVNDAAPADHANSVTGGITSVSNPTLIGGCSNTGTIRSNSPYVGGIIGILYEVSDSDDPIVAGCFNSGTIIPGSSSQAGGIAGVVTNKNNIYISNCFNSSVINGSKGGGVFGGFVTTGSGSAPIAPGDTPAANIYRCFYNTTGSAYENMWGTAIKSDAMKTKDFVNKLNDFSELLAVPGFDVLSPILNNCFQYKADSYPVLK